MDTGADTPKVQDTVTLDLKPAPRSSLELVREFHETFGVAIAGRPQVTDPVVMDLRLTLLREELHELADACMQQDPVATLDALTDLQYVLDGTYLALGLHPYKEAALAEVHRSNMSKIGEDGRPVLRADGKILKGPRYTPPDLRGVLNVSKT